MLYSCYVLSLVLFAVGIQAGCYDPSPAFVHPKFRTYHESTILKDTFSGIAANLKKLISQPEYDNYSFSIEVTTSEDSLWELHHTARGKDSARPGAKEVNSESVYRVASITKAFTTLAIIQQHVAGNLSIDDTIDQYLDLKGDIPWKDITLRTVASQLSGIPREFAQSDLLNSIPDPVALGLPPVTGKGLVKCGEAHNRPCSGKDLLESLAKKQPLWPPKQKSTYSNVNFDLLGLVIEKVTGVSFADYVEQSILQPLGMNSSSFIKPKDSVAVLPRGGNYWDVEEGVQRPTGGLYSSSGDMSKFLRYVLNTYNGLSPQFNWFNPGSYSTAIGSYYGMPWEIYRTSSILPSTSRPVTFVTKGGSLPGYFTYIIMVPDYNLGITIFTAGNASSLSDLIRETLTVPLLKAAEDIVQIDLSARYTGTFTAKDLNSTLILAQNESKSLYIESFISNSTDIFSAWQPLLLEPLVHDGPFRIQLVPTLLYRDEENHKGELWRGTIVLEERNHEAIWDGHCMTDLDPLYYAGTPLLEVVFWGGEDGENVVDEVELSGFRVKMERVGGEESSGGGTVEVEFTNGKQQEIMWKEKDLEQN